MRFLIVGAGAVGGYVGAHLALAGYAVTFAVRPATAERLAAQGLRLQLPGDTSPREVEGHSIASPLAAALAGRDHDCLILAVKSFDTAAVLAEVRTAGTSPPPILCLQNGVDNEAAIAAELGERAVIAGTVTTPVSRSAGGDIVVEKARGVGIALEHPMAAQVAQAFRAARLETRCYPAADPMKWSKLLTNLLGNAQSALLDMPVGALLADRNSFALEVAAQRECLRVMRALGYGVVNLPGVPVRLLALAFERLPGGVGRPLLGRAVGAGRGAKMPSLHADVRAGRLQTEAAWLNGAVARHGARLGISAPVNQALAELVDDLSAGGLGRDVFAGKPAALRRHILG
jgi:2-dehydropantoate 2-reductase